MVIITKQRVQAVAASTISLIGCVVLRELFPYRKRSDNVIAVLCQSTIFLWCFVLTARDAGALNWVPAVVVGSALVLVIVGVFCMALWMARNEMNEDAEALQVEPPHGTQKQDDEDIGRPETTPNDAQDAGAGIIASSKVERGEVGIEEGHSVELTLFCAASESERTTASSPPTSAKRDAAKNDSWFCAT